MAAVSASRSILPERHRSAHWPFGTLLAGIDDFRMIVPGQMPFGQTQSQTREGPRGSLSDGVLPRGELSSACSLMPVPPTLRSSTVEIADVLWIGLVVTLEESTEPATTIPEARHPFRDGRWEPAPRDVIQVAVDPAIRRSDSGPPTSTSGPSCKPGRHLDGPRRAQMTGGVEERAGAVMSTSYHPYDRDMASVDLAEHAHDQLRLITQYGNMTQSYKLVLARSLLDVASAGRETIPLGELAVPYAEHLCRHMKDAPRQGVMGGSILRACHEHNEERITFEQVVDTIAYRGFTYVLDAFPVIGRKGESDVRLYERISVGGQRGLRLDEALLALGNATPEAAIEEVEARWRLVEHSWASRATGDDNRVRFDPEPEVLISVLQGRRKPIAHFRPALNSYHRDRCFYCEGRISLVETGYPSHIDHVFPVIEMARSTRVDVDQFWNLVLTCVGCNLGKRDRLPDKRFVAKLHRRNEALIRADHPRKETIMAATGKTPRQRMQFIQRVETEIAQASSYPRRWEPTW